jgi:hypothetical protein
MRDPASLPAEQYNDVLRRLPADLDLDQLAKQTKAIQRRREISDGASLLRLALARGPGGLSLSQTAAWADLIGMAGLSDPAVKYRLDHAVPFLKAVMERQLAVRAGATALRWPGRVLRAADGSTITQRAHRR